MAGRPGTTSFEAESLDADGVMKVLDAVKAGRLEALSRPGRHGWSAQGRASGPHLGCRWPWEGHGGPATSPTRCGWMPPRPSTPWSVVGR